MRALALALAAAVVLAATTASASPESGHTLISVAQLKRSKRLCESSWPEAKRPSKAMTDRCLQYWLFAYNYDRPGSLAGIEDALSLDPSPRGGARYTAVRFKAMAGHVRRAFPKDSGWLVSRAIELFEASAGSYTSFFDMNVDVPGAMAKILAGEPMRAELAAASDTTLWLLRNAVYARHGRKFKHPDLNHDFYGRWKRPREVARLFPRVVDPTFTDARLTRTDRATVRRIRAAEKKR